MTDPWTNWTDDAAERAAEEVRADERRREAIAEILVARGHAHAAGLVAISTFRSVQVDNWDGGQFEGRLSIPAAQYDLATDEVRERIESAVCAVIGADHYQRLCVDVRLGAASAGWEYALLSMLRDQQERADPSPLALPASGER